MQKSKYKFLPLCAFVLVVISSAVFRTSNLHLIEFKADEGINLFLASRPLFEHPFPPIGIISSAGIPNPPFFSYLLLPIVYITLDPKAISFIIGNINSLAIGLLFLLVYRYYGLSIALFSSALISVSPWSILFSRKLWPPDFILPFMVAILYSLHKIVVDKKDFFWLPYTIMSLFLIQLYHPTMIFVFLVTAFLLIQKTKPNVRYVAIGILIGILPLLPYLVYQLQNGCTDCSSVLGIKEKLALRNSPEMFLRPMQITGQGNFQFLLGNDMHTFATNYPYIYELRKLLYIPYLLLPLGMIIFWKRYTKLRFLVYTTISIPILYFFLRLEPFIHYFAVIIPILFLFVGVGLASPFSHKALFIKVFSGLIFVALVVTYVLFNATFFDLLNRQRILKGDYGTAFSQAEKLTKKRFHKYLNDKHYKEMVIASYVQRASIAGSTALARAVYQQKQTKKNIDQLDQRLKEVPNDARVENELLAYYTLLPKTPETMKTLREKTLQNPHYHNIYEEIYRQYLAKNLKKAYRGLHFSLEYPMHWSQTELPSDGIMLKIDEFYMVINRNHPENKDLAKLMHSDATSQKTYNIQKVKALQEKIKRMECLTSQDKWCGTKYDAILINQNPYLIFYQTTLTQSHLPHIDDKKLNFITKEMDRVVMSLREESL